jgi:hypothetical protein
VAINRRLDPAHGKNAMVYQAPSLLVSDAQTLSAHNRTAEYVKLRMVRLADARDFIAVTPRRPRSPRGLRFFAPKVEYVKRPMRGLPTSL